LLDAGEAFKGLKDFDDEWRQAETQDYVHLADTILAAISTPKVPKEYLQGTVDLMIANFKWYQETRTLLGK
jgi:hypothetical protein